MAAAILTVTPNVALDVTYAVPALVPYGVHRVTEVTTTAGGKGVNVARVLAALGVPVTVTGLAGGATGAAVRAELVAAGLPDRLVEVAADTRRTVVVHAAEPDAATLFNEPGGAVTGAEWDAFLGAYPGLLDGVAVVVCSGSLPPGVPEDAYAGLVALARERGVASVVDAEGTALAAAVTAGPDLVTPNHEELRATTGHADPAAGAYALREAGARAVVVSRGADGLLAVTGDGAWSAAPPERLRGNATGAGDACTAALAAGLAAGTPWPERLADAVALSAAAVVTPVAGRVDLAVRDRLRPAVTVVPRPGS